MKITLSTVLIVLACTWELVVCRPAEEPTRITLSTEEGDSKNSAIEPISRLDQGRELLARLADVVRIARGRFVNSVTLARNILADRAEMLASESQTHVVTAIDAKTNLINDGRRSIEALQATPHLGVRPFSRETVRLENETAQGILEKPKFNPVSGVLENFFQPTPIVDGIREEEKYGNSGDKFIGIGRALVNGFEGFSNFLNSVVDLPVNAAKKTSRGITEALNQIGARLIGLQ